MSSARPGNMMASPAKVPLQGKPGNMPAPAPAPAPSPPAPNKTITPAVNANKPNISIQTQPQQSSHPGPRPIQHLPPIASPSNGAAKAPAPPANLTLGSPTNATAKAPMPLPSPSATQNKPNGAIAPPPPRVAPSGAVPQTARVAVATAAAPSPATLTVPPSPQTARAPQPPSAPKPATAPTSPANGLRRAGVPNSPAMKPSGGGGGDAGMNKFANNLGAQDDGLASRNFKNSSNISLSMRLMLQKQPEMWADPKFAASNIVDVWEHYDVNKDGILNKSEIPALAKDLCDRVISYYKESIRQQIKNISESDVEKQVKKDLPHLLPGKDMNESRKIMADFIAKELDVDKDGVITRTEFFFQWKACAQQVLDWQKTNKALSCVIL